MAEVTKGGAPSAQRQRARKVSTFSQLCDRFIEEYAKIYKKPRGVDLDNMLIRLYIKPNLGSMKATAISQQHIASLHASLKEKPSTANRILDLLGKIFILAEQWDEIPPYSNPVRYVKRYQLNGRERYLTDEEAKKLGEVLRACEQDGSESPHVIALFRLLMLTGARLGEIQHAQWDWVDFERGLLLLPDSKTGKKVLHLSDAALEVLHDLPRIEGNPHIIMGAVEGKSLNTAQKPWRRIRKKAGLEDVRIHDLRHTYASKLVNEGVSLPIVAKLLGHKQTRTSERYAHLHDNPIKAATNKVRKKYGQSLKK